ncbi:phosphotransferase [Nonomuraea sp. NPDC050022]|uniref:phosphotransferase n=1 Tax=Nonomuraea sp. NPDC050022 TaxID=3364358 RepID=UPI0037B115E5
MPVLAPRLPLPVPTVVRIGEPSERFPWPWTITAWVPGEPADRASITHGGHAADSLGGFLRALHQHAPADRDHGGAGPRGRVAAPVLRSGHPIPHRVRVTDEAMIRRARGWAILRGLMLISIGRAGDRGLPGGETWGPAGRSAIDRVLASI